jgi:hypothetical protein
MAVKQTRRQTIYGYPNPQAGLQQEPIILQRDPTIYDSAELGAIAINTVAHTFFILTNNQAGVNSWTSTTAGATNLASLVVNPGNATVTAGNLTVSAGNFAVSAGTATVNALSAGATTLTSTLAVTGNTTIGGTLGVTGNTILTGDLTVNGNTIINGDFDITSAQALSFTTTSNTNPALSFTTNGGAAETIDITAVQGTSASSINISSTVGGVTIHGGKATANSIDITTAAAGGITASYGSSGMTLTGTGTFALATGANTTSISADAVGSTLNLGTGAAVIKNINIGGTGANVIALGNTQTAGSIAIGNAMTGGTITIGGTGLQVGTISIAPGTGAQAVNIATGGTGVKTIHIGTGAIGNLITIGTVTAAASLTLNSGSAGTLITSTGAFTVHTGTSAINIGTDVADHAIIIGGNSGVNALDLVTGTGALTITSTAPTAVSVTAGDLELADGDLVLATAATKIVLPGPVNILTGAGVPANALAQNCGDLYINTTAVTTITRLYIATGAGAWTYFTANA